MVVGLGVRAVRDGSIGREEPKFGERAFDPRRKREALAPVPATKIPAPWFQADRLDPQARARLGLSIGL